mgnify:CR=1 FL=1
MRSISTVKMASLKRPNEPNCWVNVECPDNDDFKFLTEELKVPESFLEDIADVDERPRTETEDNWLLTILRIPDAEQPTRRAVHHRAHRHYHQ